MGVSLQAYRIRIGSFHSRRFKLPKLGGGAIIAKVVFAGPVDPKGVKLADTFELFLNLPKDYPKHMK